jgi:hypothetical protein
VDRARTIVAEPARADADNRAAVETAMTPVKQREFLNIDSLPLY